MMSRYILGIAGLVFGYACHTQTTGMMLILQNLSKVHGDTQVEWHVMVGAIQPIYRTW